jgi:16S rRNA processing protein RimM
VTAKRSTSISLTDELREVGRIGRPHGVRGDLYVSLITDRTERVEPGATLRAGTQWLTVATSRPMGGRWLVHFEGIDDRTAAEGYVGRTLLAAPLPPSDDEHDDDLWVHDLIGARVVEVDGTDRGTCVSVLANPAHDLLELDGGALVPVTFVVTAADGVVTIDPPDGLFE